MKLYDVQGYADLLKKHEVPRTTAISLMLRLARPDQVQDVRVAVFNAYGWDCDDPGGGSRDTLPAVDEVGGSLQPWSLP